MTPDWRGERPDDPAGDGPLKGAPEGRPDLPSPEEELWVARTLAEQPDPALPAALGRRLDARLAALVAERRAGDGSGMPEVGRGHGADLPGRTRRRRWPQVLLAAAAVLVGGYAVGTGVVGSAVTGAGEDSSSADHGAAAKGGGDPEGSSRDAPDATAERTRLSTSTVPLRSEHLRADVRRLLAVADQEGTRGDPTDRAEEPASQCATPAVRGAATLWLVELVGAPAVLVTTPRDARVRATVYSCDTAPLATTTVRAP